MIIDWDNVDLGNKSDEKIAKELGISKSVVFRQRQKRKIPPCGHTKIPVEKRFWSKVKKTENCWIWTAAKAAGYGQFMSDKKRYDGAHRYSYRLHYGEFDESLFVLHKCDNKICVNPNHLFLGTQQDNIDDMIAKGRQAIGDELNHRCQKGENNFGSKLKKEQVYQIKLLFKKGLTRKEIATKTGATYGNVIAILQGKSWKDVIV
jgi:hypothetical protein